MKYNKHEFGQMLWKIVKLYSKNKSEKKSAANMQISENFVVWDSADN